jgi:hypothetical protein
MSTKFNRTNSIIINNNPAEHYIPRLLDTIDTLVRKLSKESKRNKKLLRQLLNQRANSNTNENTSTQKVTINVNPANPVPIPI